MDSAEKRQHIFNAAADLTDSAARAAYLDAACGDDSQLRSEIDDLLRHDQAAASFLDKPAAAPPPVTMTFETANESAGERIGPYKLLQKLGEGGMGTVWAAEQDEPVKRRVALKVIKPGMDTAQVLRRFEAERQALAVMDHTHIAKVLDAGTTSKGRPYFVMELIKGVPITRYCDELHLSLRERLELFVPLCQAIQHAHQKGIIHRDVKPSNVLVAIQDGKPVPKIIDFGVVKALHQPLTERSMFTEIGQIVGTLEYMSPEQAELSALDIDTRADVYALGVLLYELLTGTTPLDRKRLKQAAHAEMLRIIREVEPAKPSTRLSQSHETLASLAAQRRTEPTKLTRAVRGDLDWIAMRCLEKDRTRRYATANDLARDIQRHLDDQAVEACPPSTVYRLRKLLRRHKGPVSAAALVLLVLLGGMLGTAWGLVRAETARRQEFEQRKIAEAKEAQAVAEEAKARAAAAQERLAKDQARAAIDQYIGAVVESELLNDGRFQPLRKKLLADALQYYEEFARALEHDPEGRGDLADALARVSVVNYQSGSVANAVAAIARAVELYRSLRDANPGVASYECRLADALNDQGTFQEKIGELDAAWNSYQSAQTIYERLTTSEDAVSDYQDKLAVNCVNLGALEDNMGRRSQALANMGRALGIYEKLASNNPTVKNHQFHLAGVYVNLGRFQREAGEPQAALANFRRAREIFEQLVAENPAAANDRNHLAVVYCELGDLQAALGERLAALGSLSQAIAVQEELAAMNPNVPAFRGKLARSLTNVGILHGQAGDHRAALASFQRAATIREKLVEENPTVVENQQELAGSINNIAGAQYELGDRAAALANMQRSVAIKETLAAQNPELTLLRHDLALSFSNLGIFHSVAGDHQAALASFQRAVAIEERLATDNPDVVKYQNALATGYDGLAQEHSTLGNGEAALANLRRAVAIQETLTAQNPDMVGFQSDLGREYSNLASLVARQGDAEGSLVLYAKSVQTLERVLGVNSQNPTARFSLQNAFHGRALSLSRLERFAEAAADFHSAAELAEGTTRNGLRLAGTAMLARAGDHFRASAEAGEIASVKGLPANILYNLGCIYSLCCGAAGDDASLAEEYATRAVELLDRCRATGFFSDPANREHLDDDPDLSAIRDRDDFRQLTR
jgi:serine/threonine protein kinase/tetratricopeptide (TPR) repeat protein